MVEKALNTHLFPTWNKYGNNTNSKKLMNKTDMILMRNVLPKLFKKILEDKFRKQ